MSVVPKDSAPEPNPTVLLYISLSFGTALAINVWVFYRITGGMFNPAVCFDRFIYLVNSSVNPLR